MPAVQEFPPWWLPARWPAPPLVRAGITTRRGGDSKHPFQGFNLATHVGDDASVVSANRAALRQGLCLPAEPCWLHQVHGSRMVAAAAGPGEAADGSHASGPGRICAVMVADCVPLLLTDSAGRLVAAVHAGWRGIAAGIVGSALAAMGAPADQVLAWIGPCIGPDHYEVGADVRSACLRADPDATECFRPTSQNHWLADLPCLVRRQLRRQGVSTVHGGDICVHEQQDLFFSHRRDGQTGRMAALIWLERDHS